LSLGIGLAEQLAEDVVTAGRRAAVGKKVLVRAVKRNLARFPPDFVFQLSAESSRL
jgi:hypothetical protein